MALEIVEKLPLRVKYNLGIGVNDKSLSKEYFPICGNPEFIRNAQSLILRQLGKDAINNWLNDFIYGVEDVQALSGTDALRILCDFIGNKYLNSRTSTWGSYTKIILHSGIKKALKYQYFDSITKGINVRGMLSTLRQELQPSDFILLHPCAHSSTGVDPTESEWKIINELELISKDYMEKNPVKETRRFVVCYTSLVDTYCLFYCCA